MFFTVTLRAFLGLSLAASLAACVPTQTAAPPAGTAAPLVAAAAVPDTGIYLATSDNGFAVASVDPAKVPGEFQRQVVDFPSAEAPGTIVINPAARHLFFITGNGKAIRYGISVGKAGFEWSGEARVTNRRNWPTWTPPPEMIERKPELSKWEKGQPGGPTNPLGARALYLTTNGVDYGYRIHGTPDWWSIGKNASSGCIRMINQDVMDLYGRVPNGAKVIVLNADGSVPASLKLPPPAPKKKEPAPKASPAVAETTDAAGVPVPATVTVPKAPLLASPSATLPGAKPATLPTPLAAPATQPPPSMALPVTPATPAAAPATPLVTPAAPAVTPAAPAVTPSVAPSVAPIVVPACALPVVNGVCPKA